MYPQGRNSDNWNKELSYYSFLLASWEILYERILITTYNLSHYCFDTSYIFI